MCGRGAGQWRDSGGTGAGQGRDRAGQGRDRGGTGAGQGRSGAGEARSPHDRGWSVGYDPAEAGGIREGHGRDTGGTQPRAIWTLKSLGSGTFPRVKNTVCQKLTAKGHAQSVNLSGPKGEGGSGL